MFLGKSTPQKTRNKVAEKREWINSENGFCTKAPSQLQTTSDQINGVKVLERAHAVF